MTLKEARIIVQVATKNGELPKAKEKVCERCGLQAEDRHHEDYTKPLEVNYLCQACHHLVHRERGDKRHYMYLCDRPTRPVSGKHRRLLVRVTCASRDFYLCAPSPGGKSWNIRFTPPLSVRQKTGIRERVIKSTGIEYCMETVEAAKHVARRIIESYWNVDAIELVKQRNGFAKLSEIVKRYRDGARTIVDKEELNPGTINKNVTSLIRIVEARFYDGKEKRAPGSWENTPADLLTAELLTDFKRGWLSTIRQSDLQAMSSAKHTVNSYIRQARSLFADEYMPLYRGLELPDLSDFRKVPMFKRPGSTRYVPIPQRTIDAMEAEIRALRNERPDIYLGFYFMLWLGMRVSEVCNARLEWIEEWPERPALMAIVRRSYYKPKGIDGMVSIGPTLLADIRELSGATAAMDHLIPGPNIKKAVGRELSEIIRRHLGGDRRKTCHELRKHAISMQLMRTKNYVDTLKFSRHSDVRTLRNHYEAFLDDLAPITSSDWRVA